MSSTDSGSASAPAHSPRGRAMTRRGLLKRAAAMTAAVGVTAGAPQSPISPVGEAEAIAPAVVALGVAGAGVVGVSAGWMLREWTAPAADVPSDALGPDALKQQVYETAKTRKSTNADTIVNSDNIVKNVDHALYADGKIAAIKALNDQKPKSDVESDALAAMNQYATTIQKNFIDTWNEACNEAVSLYERVDSSEEIDARSKFIASNQGTYESESTSKTYRTRSLEAPEQTVDLADESTYGIRELQLTAREGSTNHGDVEYFWSPLEDGNESLIVEFEDVDLSVGYMHQMGWHAVWSELGTVITNTQNGLVTWVDTVYDDVQAGDLDPAELITPREMAEMSGEEMGARQAIADLIALNMPTDFQNEATIYLPNIDARITGMLTSTGTLDVAKGEEIDPETASEDFFFTYDVSTGNGTWAAYDDAKGVDGGEIWFTQPPYPDTVYQVVTAADETAEVQRSDFTAYDTNDESLDNIESPDAEYWEANIGSQLDNQITQIEEVRFYATDEASEGVVWETIRLNQPFTVEKIVDSETGEEKDQIEFERTEPQRNDNYITKEEWDQMTDQNEKMLEEWEQWKAENSGGGGGDWVPDWFPDGEGAVQSVVAGAVAIVAVAAALPRILGNN